MMQFKNQDVQSVKQTRKKIRIGSRVPEENREWLKSHGIVTETLPPAQPVLLRSPKKTSLSVVAFWTALLILASLIVASYQVIAMIQGRLAAEGERRASMEGANYHLRGSVEKLLSINQAQQFEINRMGKQVHELSVGFRSKIESLQKGAAMSEDLHLVYEGALAALTAQYDTQVAVLRKELAQRNNDLTSKGAVLPQVREVVVTADSPAARGISNNHRIVLINLDFQFVVIDSGAAEGIQIGQMVELYHRNHLVGYGQIEKLYPDFAGVKVFSWEALNQLEKGDFAILKSITSAELG